MITPMGPMPVAPAADGAAAAPANASGSGLAGESFAALIAAQLGDLADPGAVPVATGPGNAEAVSEDQGDTVPVVPGTAEAAAPVDPAGLAVQAAVAPPATTATPSPAPTSPVPADGITDGDDVAPAELPTVRGHAAGTPDRTGALPAPVVAVPAEAPAHPGGPEVEEAAASGSAAQTAAGPASAARTEPATSQAPAAPAAPAAPTPATTPQAVAAPLPATPATPATPANPAGPVSNPVLDQVTPTFTRMVSGPEGMHRMMLRLHPADLGEIHLTVRVTGDTVDVTVAARPEARQMLVDGHSELRGLLDAVGRTATQITFRDLPGTGTAVQVVQTGGHQGSTNPDGQSGTQQGGYTPGQGQDLSGGSGESRGNGHTGAGRADQTSSSPPDGRPGAPAETRPTTTPRTAGHVPGGLDVRM